MLRQNRNEMTNFDKKFNELVDEQMEKSAN